jgi:hypothetical protein
MPDVGSGNLYNFTNPIGGGYISITLTWDRPVTSTGDAHNYSGSDLFTGGELDNLDVWLEKTDGTIVAASVSTDRNVEHIFSNNFGAGAYRIRVTRLSGQSENGNYALAWWYGSGSGTPISAKGDYNNDGIVDSNDYQVWRTNFGSTSQLDADGNGNGIVDAADYTIWRDHLGQMAGSGSAAAVPESSSVVLLLTGIVLACATILQSRNIHGGSQPSGQGKPRRSEKYNGCRTS